MPVKLVWSPQARVDAKRIYVEIALEQPQAAERYFQKFRHRADLLKEHPRLGRRHPEIALAARALVEGPYLILYETVPDTDDGPVMRIEIVRIVDGRRNMPSLFR